MATDFFLNLPGGSGGGGGATPGGVNGEIQWNDAGTLAGATITTDGTNLNLVGGTFQGGFGASLQDDGTGKWNVTGPNQGGWVNLVTDTQFTHFSFTSDVGYYEIVSGGSAEGALTGALLFATLTKASLLLDASNNVFLGPADASAGINTQGNALNLNGGPFLGGNGATLQDANDSFGGWRLTGSDTTSTTISSVSNGMYLGSGNDINTVSRYPNAYAAINDSFWGDNGTYSSFYVQMNNADMSADVPFFIRGDGSFQLGGTALPFQAGGPAGASMWGDASQNLFFNGHIVSMNDGSGSGGGTLNMDGAQIKNIGYSTSAPTLAANSEFGFSYNEGTNAFTITVKRSDGVVKTGTVICT